MVVGLMIFKTSFFFKEVIGYIEESYNVSEESDSGYLESVTQDLNKTLLSLYLYV